MIRNISQEEVMINVDGSRVKLTGSANEIMNETSIALYETAKVVANATGEDVSETLNWIVNATVKRFQDNDIKVAIDVDTHKFNDEHDEEMPRKENPKKEEPQEDLPVDKKEGIEKIAL